MKILRSTDKMDTAGLGQSKGCGFVEFMSHESALAALRAVNNNPDTLPSHRVGTVHGQCVHLCL